jgi:hypothetical protein
MDELTDGQQRLFQRDFRTERHESEIRFFVIFFWKRKMTNYTSVKFVHFTLSFSLLINGWRITAVKFSQKPLFKNHTKITHFSY